MVPSGGNLAAGRSRARCLRFGEVMVEATKRNRGSCESCVVVVGSDEDSIGALEEMYRSGYRRFFRLALAVCGTNEAAADAVHDAFVRAIRGRAGLRDPDALEAWVWRTVLNTARTQRALETQRPVAVGAVDAPATGNGRAREWPELRAAVAALPERQRSVLFLRHYADLDYDRIAAVLGIARGTVAATLNQAHATLRRTLEVPR